MHRRLHTCTHVCVCVRENHNAPTPTKREGHRSGERDGDRRVHAHYAASGKGSIALR